LRCHLSTAIYLAHIAIHDRAKSLLDGARSHSGIYTGEREIKKTK
jgi:hypothetical protein